MCIPAISQQLNDIIKNQKSIETIVLCRSPYCDYDIIQLRKISESSLLAAEEAGRSRRE